MNDSYKSIFFENYLTELQNLKDRTNNIDEKVDLYSIYYDIINLFFDLLRNSTSSSNQIFPSNFSRWIYLIQKIKLNNIDEFFISKLQKIKKNIKSNKNIESQFFEEVYQEILNYSIEILKSIKGFNINNIKRIDENINENDKAIKQVYVDNKDAVDYILEISGKISIKGVLKEKRIKKDKIEKKVFICLNEDLGKFFIILDNSFDYLFESAELNSTLNFLYLDVFNIENKVYIVSSGSYIVYESDYLFDITELSECFSMKEINPITYFLKILTDSQSSLPLLKGTLVNSIFDELIVNPNIDFETCFHKAIKQRPLRLLPLINRKNSEELKNELKSHYESISFNIPNFPFGTQLIEPSFISNSFGLQGRLDLLIESKDEPDCREVIELKSGKSPSGMIKFGNFNSKLFLNTWVGHSAQANGYNLLLESVFPKRTGSSSIFYSSDIEKGFRNVPNIIEIKKNIINLRNRIFILVQKVLSGELDIFNLILREDFRDNLQIESKSRISQKLRNLDTTERHYYSEALKFILKEEIISKLGNENNTSGQSLLWNSSPEEKLDRFSILTNLEIEDNSDFDLMHIYLKFDNEQENIHFFRKGDQCLIYPAEKAEDPTKFYVIKGFIREIESGRLLLSLLNKSIDRNIIQKYAKWILEIDYSDSLIKKQFAVLSKFIEADKSIRDLLLGFRAPSFENNSDIQFEYLNEHQNGILNSAINAKDYLLIQGPPGTGKTSRLIRAISDFNFNFTENKVLLCAYTNRAVDEICEALEKVKIDFPFLRISGKELENFYERSIPCLSGKLTISALKKEILKTRFFVSTVSSLQTNPEIFDLVKFDLLILDEASQVLETQIIGILSQVRRFILIGDEKQLPAIVLHETNTDEILQKKIHFNNFSESLFQRLIRTCKNNHWTDAIETLTFQGRMHQEIQKLSNYLVYNNQLSTFNSDWQTKANSFWYDNSKDMIKRILEKRVVFINSPKQKGSKINFWEVEQCSKIIKNIHENCIEHFDDRTIGVISPFRLQCRSIINSLSENIRKLVTVDTVERFQGSEREIIILSLATNYDYLLSNIMNEAEIEGNTIDRKLNVAITRAKEHLIIFGNETILSKSSIYGKAIEWIKENGLFIQSL